MKAADIAQAKLVEQARPAYQADLAAGVDRFFEPRRDKCPWCDGDRLGVALRTTDLLQHKPGRFQLDRCLDCDHVFQNPRLTEDGLEFYYRDCYDGLGEQQMNKLFSDPDDRIYSARAKAAAPFAKPASWLDVGTGHGHFPHAAKQVFPDTEFDGLDLSAGVELAHQKGWIANGYRGQFVDLAAELADRYDAVSMFHYLEHTTDPRQQLEAALKVLRTGGHLVIEVPDPECRWGRVLGRWWLPWLQPQHLNFVPIGNLRNALAELGFTVCREQRAEAHSRNDLVFAVYLAAHRALRAGEDVPWRPRPVTRAMRILRTAGFVGAIPVFLVAGVLDRVLAGFTGSRGFANAYRVVAVKN